MSFEHLRVIFGRAKAFAICVELPGLGALSVFRRDQQQALRFRPGAKGRADGIGFLQRRGALDLLQQVLCVAVEMIAARPWLRLRANGSARRDA